MLGSHSMLLANLRGAESRAQPRPFDRDLLRRRFSASSDAETAPALWCGAFSESSGDSARLENASEPASLEQEIRSD
jgi:hypothetical protein